MPSADDRKIRDREYYLANREKRLAAAKAYAAANKEKIKLKQAEYRKKNKDMLNARCREWHLNNKGKVKASKEARREIIAEQRKAWWAANADKMKEWKRVNAEKIRGYEAKWRNTNKDKVNAKTGRRNAQRVQATPAWADDFVMSEMYDLAQRRNKATGFEWHVDHIVPLRSKIVCGLHCENNLRVIPGKENIAKNNLYWPDMP